MSDKITNGVLAGSVDFSMLVKLVDAAGAGVTGVAHGDVTSITAWRQGAAAVIDITPASLAALNTAHADGGWKEIDATKMPGLYRLDLTDACVATGADWVGVTVIAPGAIPFSERLDLRSVAAGNVTKINGDADAAVRLADLAGIEVTVVSAEGYEADQGAFSLDPSVRFTRKNALALRAIRFKTGPCAGQKRYVIRSSDNDTRTRVETQEFSHSPEHGDTAVILG